MNSMTSTDLGAVRHSTAGGLTDTSTGERHIGTATEWATTDITLHITEILGDMAATGGTTPRGTM